MLQFSNSVSIRIVNNVYLALIDMHVRTPPPCEVSRKMGLVVKNPPYWQADGWCSSTTIKNHPTMHQNIVKKYVNCACVYKTNLLETRKFGYNKFKF